MKNLIQITIGTIGFSLLISCAHKHPDVRPGAEGIHKITINSITKDRGMKSSLEQATNYCKSQKSQLAIIDESSTYQGQIDEDVYKQGQNIKDAASVLLGPIVRGKAKDFTEKALGKPYLIQMTFKCQ